MSKAKAAMDFDSLIAEQQSNVESFYGAYIRHADLRNNGELCRIDMSCDLNTATAEMLECEELRESDSFKRASLKMEPLLITEFRLVFSGLERQPLEALAYSLGDFRVVRIQEGESLSIHELRFHISCPGEVIGLVREYWKLVGDGRGQLTIRKQEESQLELVDEPEQTTLDGVDAAPKRGRGRPKKEPTQLLPLASVREMEQAGVN